MRKAILLLGIFLLTFGALRLLAPPILIQFLALDPIVAWLGIGVGTIAILNGSTWFRMIDLRIVFRALGFTLLMAALYGINSPTFGDIRQTYVPVADLFVALEAGIAMLILSTEKSEEAVSPLVYVTLIATMVYHRATARYAEVPSLSRHKQA